MNIPMETPYFTVREDPNRALKHKRFLLTPRDDGDATDAVASYTVPAPKPCEDSEHINLYEPADASTERDWLKKLGSLTADSLVAPLLRSAGRAWDPATTTRLTRLPRDYALYVHKDGHRRAPRRDYYLYGSRFVNAFRSPAEFAPHFVWLMGGKPMKEDGKRACECKYCAHEEGGQRAVNEKMRKKRRAARDGTERGPLSDSPTNLLPRAGPSG